jgi:pyruvate/oxaloacetate carboxyltransferase
MTETDTPDQVPHTEDQDLVRLEQLRRQRFQQRVQRVLEAMRRERIDWRAVPYLTPDGRIIARILPVEMASEES